LTTFEEVLDKVLYKVQTTLNKKEAEYATNINRYHNFDKASKMLDTSPEDALRGMLIKHLVSVFDLVDAAIEEREDFITKELVDEKIIDSINYLILLYGLFIRRIEARKKQTK
jgi:hypothetical protein